MFEQSSVRERSTGRQHTNLGKERHVKNESTLTETHEEIFEETCEETETWKYMHLQISTLTKYIHKAKATCTHLLRVRDRCEHSHIEASGKSQISQQAALFFVFCTADILVDRSTPSPLSYLTLPSLFIPFPLDPPHFCWTSSSCISKSKEESRFDQGPA